MSSWIDRLSIIVAIIGVTFVGWRWIYPKAAEVDSAASAIENVAKEFVLDTSDANTRGESSAKVGIVEFTDFECPFCQKYASTTLPKIQQQYVESGKIMYAVRNFPLPIHPRAFHLAGVAMCAAQQDKYWSAHDLLFQDLSDTDILAQELDLNSHALEDCTKDNNTTLRIQHDMEIGNKIRILSTPTFYLGNLDKHGALTVKTIIHGAQPLSEFKRVLDNLLSRAASGYDPTRNAALDLLNAKKEGAQSGKRILLEVGGEWCSWCRALDRLFDANQEVRELRDRKYITVKINVSSENLNENVLSNYPQINQYPHLLVLDDAGTLLHSERTDALEKNQQYDVRRVVGFLQKWSTATR